MTERPTKIVADLSTGETKIIPLTDEEIQQRELDAIEAATRKAEENAQATVEAELKASAKAKLMATGLTEAEIAAFLK